MSSLEELFCSVDDFDQKFEPKWQQHLLQDGLRRRSRTRQMYLSEIMTIVISFHQSHYRNFKAFYTQQVSVHWRQAFPALVSYNRFVEWIPSTLMPLSIYLYKCFGRCSGISLMDSTCIRVCHNRRISQHKVFADFASRGKTSVDWFFGFKLHLIFNDRGELLNMTLTPGNTDERQPVFKLLRRLFGKVIADKGYISQPLFERLLRHFSRGNKEAKKLAG